VTEPDAQQIEIFRIASAAGGAPEHVAVVAVPDGPESLVIDALRGRAYSHVDGGKSVAIDLASRAVVETWDNGCQTPKGIALDEARGFLLVGCGEGTLVALDATNHGARVGAVTQGSGIDVLGYSPSLGHLYAPGATSATLAIVGVGAHGALTLLDTVATAAGAHCATTDDAGTVFVCDPDHGQLLVATDGQASSFSDGAAP
jgi:hypothetical protein